MNIGTFVAGQLRKPHGISGNFFGFLMNRANHNLNEFMKDTLDVQDTDHLLEIGFGSGKLIEQFAMLAKNGRVVGIDISDVMVARAKKVNQQYISKGVVEIQKASVANIPYESDSFDKVCSANTIYFWPNPEDNITEIYRVLRAGGKIVLGFRTKEQLQKLAFSRHGFQLYTKEDLADFLSSAGFRDVNIVKRHATKFDSYCVTATKPMVVKRKLGLM